MSKGDRDYDIKDIVVDERFIIAKKEMLITFAVQISFTLIMIFTAYTVGNGDPKDYTYIMGMPSWWFYCLAITIVFLGIIYILTSKVYKNVSVEAYLEIENAESDKK